jgi:hypothetical protein
MLRDKIYQDLVAAMKARDQEKLETIRYIWSEIKRVEIDAKHNLGDEEVVDLMRREVKRRSEAIAQMRVGGRMDRVDIETAQLKIIDNYLPALMSKDEVESIIDQIIKAGGNNFGEVMGLAMAKLKGKADGKMVGEIVKSKF